MYFRWQKTVFRFLLIVLLKSVNSVYLPNEETEEEELKKSSHLKLTIKFQMQHNW